MKGTRNAIVTLVALAGCSLAYHASAAIVVTIHARVSEFFVFTEYGNGDVGFKVESPNSSCPDGYWLRPSDAGFKSAYAALMLAYSTGSTLRVAAHDDSLWPGTSGTICRVYQLSPL